MTVPGAFSGSFPDAVKICFNKYVDFNGRARRSEFWWWVLFTFLLAFTMLNVATSKDHPDNSFYGFAIGMVAAIGVLLVGGLSGAALNPAVALGVSVAKLSAWQNLWAYLVAQIAGGVVAGVAFRVLNPDDAGRIAPSN